MRRDHRLRKLVDRLQTPIVTWFIRGLKARAVEDDQRRGPLLQDRPNRGASQQHVFLDIFDAGQCNPIVQLVSDTRRQLVGAASAATSASTVVEPGPAWPPGS